MVASTASTSHPSVNSSSSDEANDVTIQRALSYVFDTIQRYRLDTPALRDGCSRVRDRASTNEVRLALLGEFNSGKTTFANALLGAPLLGTALVPTTNVLTYIAWGDAFSCKATLMDGTQIPITAENVRSYSTDAVTLARLDVRAPVPLLKGGLILIDTPGFNVQNQRHEQIVEAAIAEANACLFLMDARQPGKRTTIDFFKRVQASIDKFFLLVTRADIYNTEEREEAHEYLLHMLQSEVGLAKPRLHFISAAEALARPSSEWATSFTELGPTQKQLLTNARISIIIRRPVKRCFSVIGSLWKTHKH